MKRNVGIILLLLAAGLVACANNNEAPMPDDQAAPHIQAVSQHVLANGQTLEARMKAAIDALAKKGAKLGETRWYAFAGPADCAASGCVKVRWLQEIDGERVAYDFIKYADGSIVGADKSAQVAMKTRPAEEAKPATEATPAVEGEKPAADQAPAATPAAPATEKPAGEPAPTK